jgi:hypothetical protein
MFLPRVEMYSTGSPQMVWSSGTRAGCGADRVGRLPCLSLDRKRFNVGSPAGNKHKVCAILEANPRIEDSPGPG